MSKAVYLFDSNAKLLKKGSLTYDDVTLKYTFSATEAYITQGSIEVDELCIVVPDTMFTKANTGIFGSFVSPVRNPLGLVPGEWEARTIIDGATETTYLNCAIFALDLAFYTYVAGRYGFAIGFVDSTTGAIDKTPYDSYTVQNGVDNFTENNLTASDYDNLLTAITNLTSTIGGNVSQLLSDVATLKATAITLETGKHEFSAIVGVWNETTSKDTPIYSKLKVDEIDTAIVLNINAHKARTNNPHDVTKAQVGLENVDNTSDLNKPISTLTQNALNDKSNVGHTHTKSDITDFSHTHLIEDITDLIEATQAISGLMSATDKTRLDTLHALLEENDANTVVDSINEILAIFNNYPEGADLVSALANKVDKNNAITAGTKTKITYDAKGLVTGGSDLVPSDIGAVEEALNDGKVYARKNKSWVEFQSGFLPDEETITLNNDDELEATNVAIWRYE